MSEPSASMPDDGRRAKLAVPLPPPGIATRPDLLRRLDECLRYPLTLLLAPAGAGKTTLLAQWLRQSSQPQGEEPCAAWLSLDTTDDDLVRFWSDVLLSLDACQNGQFSALAGALRGSAVTDILPTLTALINRCAGQDRPMLLVLDAYQCITRPAIHESLAFLLQHQPPQFHLIVATRAEPPLAIANLRARGKLLELRFSHFQQMLVEQREIEARIVQALAEQRWQEAAALLDAAISGLPLKQGQSEELLAALRQLPADVVRRFPRLCLFQAEGLFVAGQLAAAESWFQAAADLTTSPPWAAQHQRQLTLYHAYTASLFGAWETAESLRGSLAPPIPEEALIDRAFVAAIQANADFARGAVPASVARLIAMSQAFEDAGNLAQAVAMLNFVAPMLLRLGRLREVWRITHQAIQLASDTEERLTTNAGPAYIYQADVLREWGRADEATGRLGQGARLISDRYDGLLLPDVLAVVARLRRATGDMAGAGAALAQLAALPLLHDNPYLRATLLADEQVRLWLAQGERARIDEWLDRIAQGTRHVSPFVREREDVGRALVALAAGRPLDALTLAEPLLDGARAAGRLCHAVEILVIQARAHQTLGASEPAFGVLAEALRLAEPEEYVRLFLDAGPPMAAMLAHMQRHGVAPEVRASIDRILAGS